MASCSPHSLKQQAETTDLFHHQRIPFNLQLSAMLAATVKRALIEIDHYGERPIGRI